MRPTEKNRHTHTRVGLSSSLRLGNITEVGAEFGRCHVLEDFFYSFKINKMYLSSHQLA